MRLADVDAAALDEARTFNAALEALLAKAPSVHTIDPAETRAARAEGRGTFPTPVMVDEGRGPTIPPPDGGPALRGREFVPPGDVRGVYLHIHGGGWVLGDARSQDVGLWRLANEASVAVLAVAYRPGAPHPPPR